MDGMDPLAPLEMVAEAMFGEIKLDHIEDEERRKWTRAVTRWYQLNYALIHEVNSKYDFPAWLSEDQYHSFRILREWWRAEYQPAEYSLAEILDIVDKCDEVVLGNYKDRWYRVLRSLQLVIWGNYEDKWYRMLTLLQLVIWGNYKDKWYRVLESLQLVKWPTKHIRCCETDKDPFYSWSMRKLFQLEFVWDTEYYRIGQLRKYELQNYRRHGKLRAYCQQLKMAVFEKEVGILDEELRTQDEDRLLEPLALEHGPPISPCPWLPKITGNRKGDMPYYLWDRDDGKTIETAELDDVVDYTAVSHTWGRWVERGQWAQVAGVPWPVPRNQQFDVHDLVNRLRSLDCRTRYLWFDLFCIPQDRSTRSKIEIARQATIFRTARRAVAWLKDVHDFVGLQAVLLYMLYSMVSMPTGTEERTDASRASRLAEDAWKAVAYKSTGLLEPREGPLRDFEIRPNVWFTSLWTLQEVCLRPDMWLCSSDWQTLSVFGNQPLSVLGILTIWRFYELEQYASVEARSHNALGFDPFSPGSLEQPGYDQSHVAFFEFWIWTHMTNLNKLPQMTRVDILSMGDKRACTGRRGEAIMSAVGVTAWFDPQAEAAGTEDLVLDKYPMSFVEELKDAEPGTFFGHLIRFEDIPSAAQGVDAGVALPPDNGPDLCRPVEYHHIKESPKGSMLPFSQHEALYFDAVVFHSVELVAHESVRSWRIQLDGSVHIPEACVLAGSSTRKRAERKIPPLGPVGLYGFTSDRIPCSVGTVSDDQRPQDGDVDLEAWIDSRDFEVHAVVVTQGVYPNLGLPQGYEEINVLVGVRGIILARLPDEAKFVKLGGFWCLLKDSIVPPTTKHDWIVA